MLANTLINSLAFFSTLVVGHWTVVNGGVIGGNDAGAPTVGGQPGGPRAQPRSAAVRHTLMQEAWHKGGMTGTLRSVLDTCSGGEGERLAQACNGPLSCSPLCSKRTGGVGNGP